MIIPFGTRTFGATKTYSHVKTSESKLAEMISHCNLIILKVSEPGNKPTPLELVHVSGNEVVFDCDNKIRSVLYQQGIRA